MPLGGYINGLHIRRVLFVNEQVRYFTEPPEALDGGVHVGAKIVSEYAQEFDINSFEAMETQAMHELEAEGGAEGIKVCNADSIIEARVTVCKLVINTGIPEGSYL